MLVLHNYADLYQACGGSKMGGIIAFTNGGLVLIERVAT